MKDKLCNDSSTSSLSLGSLNVAVTATTTTTTTSTAATSVCNQSTSDTDLSSSSSENDIHKSPLKDSPKDKTKAKFSLTFPDSDIECDCSENESNNEDNGYLGNPLAAGTKQERKKQRKLITLESFEENYDKQVETIIENAAKAVENDGSSYIKCGFYQFLSFIFISIAWSVGNGWYAYINVFAGHTPSHTCDLSGLNGGNYTHYTIDDKQCRYTNNLTLEVNECQRWVYDYSQMKSTIITEFDFVCNKNYKFEIVYSLEQIGYVIGTLIFSVIADLLGRKPVFIGVLLSMTGLGVGQFFITNFYIYMAISFLINVFASGLDSVCVPMVLELVNTKRRTSFGIGMEYIWVLILTALSLVAYLINTWRHLRLFVFIIIGVIAFASFWLVQESVTWLISTGKLKQALSVIDWVAKFNRLSDTAKFEKRRNKLDEQFRKLNIYEQTKKKENELKLAKKQSTVSMDTSGKRCQSQLVDESNNNSKGVFMDIIRHPKYRLYVLIMSLNWFATGLIYDGLTYLNSFVGENIFINWTLMNIVELPAQLVCFILLSRFGRRLTTCISLILCGVTLITTAVTSYVYKDLNWLKLALFVIAKFSSTQAYSAVILHAPEIFPTHLRSVGYGVCLFSGKLTAMISPFISLYLTKLFPWLPPVIYGLIAIVCGFTCLYVPETLNRPLPNSVDDVIKWDRNLSAEEWKIARRENTLNCNLIRKIFKKQRSTPKRVTTQNTIVLVSVNDLQSSTINKNGEDTIIIM